jgi:hypothetical protein
VSTFVSGTFKGIVSDAAGNLYVADQNSGQIKKITPAGIISVYAGSGNQSIVEVDGSAATASFLNPSALAIDNAGNIYVFDSNCTVLRKITTAGVVSTLATGLRGNLSGITVDVSGNVFVVENTLSRVKKIALDGTQTLFSSNGLPGTDGYFGSLQGITTDSAGNIYVTDNTTDAVKKITSTGVVSKYAALPYNIYRAINIKGDNFGNFYVADEIGIIYLINPSKVLSAFAGSTNSVDINGIGTAASFSSIEGITINNSGNLFATESSGAVKKVSLTGYSIIPALPSGLTMDNTGTITGTPTTVTPATNYTITAQNSYGLSSAIVNISTSLPKASQTIIFAALPAITYGDVDFAFNATATLPVTYTTDNSQIATILNGKLHIVGAGTVTITASQAGDSVHYAAADVKQALVINKKQVTITANDATRAADKPNPVFTVTYSGFVNGDDASKLTTLPSVTTAAGTSAGSFDLVPSGASSNNYAFTYKNGIFTVTPSITNITVSTVSVTCKGSNNGIINVLAAQSANYIAVVTFNGTSTTYPFTTTLSVNNLAPGTYTVCVSNSALIGYEQCFDLVITEPKDLSVYATVNKDVNSVSLALDGSTSYKIELNGTVYNTSNSNITLQLAKGSNQLSVSTDKPCQGTVDQIINYSGNPAPYPSPFKNVLYINLGEIMVNAGAVKIYRITDGMEVMKQPFTNQSGVIKFDVSTLSNGVYSLHLMADGKESVFKVIKQ